MEPNKKYVGRGDIAQMRGRIDETITNARRGVYKQLDGDEKSKWIDFCYDVIGAIQTVHAKLGAGLPEYIYQEALTRELTKQGLKVLKEHRFHPVYDGEPLESFLKMDLVVEKDAGKIIIECKAMTEMGDKEHYQLFGYLRGTGYPVGILVNFGTYPKAQIERYICCNQREIIAF